jgi:hypothetical protein
MTENTKNRSHKKIKAVCDMCGIEKYVRRSWATTRIRRTGIPEYYCIKCSSKRNVKKARRKKMDNELVNEFIGLCEFVFANLYDDKSEMWIGKQLDNTSYGLIRSARDFVYSYLNTGVDDSVTECAEYIESGADQEIIDLYTWETEMYAHALIHLESLPRPEGL